MRAWILAALVVMVTLATTNAEKKGKEQKNKEGCVFNGKLIKSGATAYKDKTHCLKLRCVLRTNKKGKSKYILKAKTFKNCLCSVPCPKCSSEWAPVCGTNNVTYINNCELWGKTQPCGEEEAEILHKGECGKCPIGCPEEARPVCGSDGKSYDNECNLLQTACTTNAQITVVHKVRCEDVPADPDKGNKCRYNGKKYEMGQTIQYLGDHCLAITCQPPNGAKGPLVTFEELKGSRSCDCATSTVPKSRLGRSFCGTDRLHDAMLEASRSLAEKVNKGNLLEELKRAAEERNNERVASSMET